MNILQILAALLTGLAVGVVFFGNLRWTVEKMKETSHPFAFYGIGLVLRMLVVLAAAYFALKIGILCLLVGMCGFSVARLFMVSSSAFGSNSWPAKGGG